MSGRWDFPWDPRTDSIEVTLQRAAVVYALFPLTVLSVALMEHDAYFRFKATA